MRYTEQFDLVSTYLYSSISQIKRDDWAMWTDEASGMYIPYQSIAEEGTSPRARFSVKFYIPPLIYMINAIKQSNTTKLTILIVVQVAFFSELTSSVSPAPASALLIGL